MVDLKKIIFFQHTGKGGYALLPDIKQNHNVIQSTV